MVARDTNGNGVASRAKMPTGIPSFDSVVRGGLPRSSTTLVLGGPGCGKTVFALQCLAKAAHEYGEAGIFVAFEENSRQILTNAATFRWQLPELEQSEQLFFVDAQFSPDQVRTGQIDLAGLLATVDATAEQVGAKCIVFDSIDVVLSLIDNPIAQKNELYRLHTWLVEKQLTGLITARTDGQTQQPTQPANFMQFMADCVITLTHRMREHVSSRGLRVVKYRGSDFAENEFPYLIGPDGIEIADLSIDETEHVASVERVSTGVDRLDNMLGGYFSGSSVLISGSPGTAKSTLAGAFAEAVCAREKRALFILFDELASELVRNLKSVNIDLERHVASGLLQMHSVTAGSHGAEEHLALLRRFIDEHQPQAVVLDPITAIYRMGGAATASGIAQRLVRLAKSRGITSVMTSVLSQAGEIEETPLTVSTMADTWIHLSYVVRGGERNRALTIVKSRGTEHSNQVRELILGSEGVSLADVYTSEGNVLMGTDRWEKERAEQKEKEKARSKLKRRRQKLDRARTEAKLRMQILQQELDEYHQELASIDAEAEIQEDRWATHEEGLRERRDADMLPLSSDQFETVEW